MNRIVLIILALVSLQLVNGQDPCMTAWNAVSDECHAAFTSSNFSVCVFGTCRNQFIDVDNNCGSTTNATINATINAYEYLCDCEESYSIFTDACDTAFINSNISVCSGTCQNYFNNVACECANISNNMIQDRITKYTNLCVDMLSCPTAQAVVTADCKNAFNNNNTAIVCVGTCRIKLNRFIDACRGMPNVPTRAQLNQLCRRSGGGYTLQAFEIITLLVVAICALMF